MPLNIFYTMVQKKSKMTKNSNQGGSCLKAGPPPPPLEAILVIFGRSSFIFFLVWKLLEKYEKWHHFCAHAQWWSPWRRKNVEKRHLAPSNLTFLRVATETVFAERKKKGWSTKFASDFLIFVPILSYDLSKFTDEFTPFFFFFFFFQLWKTIFKSLGKN